jgi:hypothetical protein
MAYFVLTEGLATATGQYFTPSRPARDDRSTLLLWQRSAVLAGMKENGAPPL